MQQVMPGDKDAIISALTDTFTAKLGPEQAPPVIGFVEHFLLNAPAEDIAGRNLEDVYGQLLGCWKFIENFNGAQPKIQVLNPNLSNHFWQSPHTVVMVLSKDMPFLVDSLRMELTRREISIHIVQSIVFQSRRDDKHQLVERSVCDYESGCSLDGGSQEALTYLEIDRFADGDELTELHDAFQEVLTDVRIVVEDFQPMRERAQHILEQLDSNPPPVSPEDIEETRTYLEWLIDHNFTFLGYKQFEVIQQDGRDVIRYMSDSGLGIVKRKTGVIQDKYIDSLNPVAQAFVQSPQLLSFAKSGTQSRVHRPAYPEYVAVRTFNDQGEVTGEHGFLGVYTLPVYAEQTRDIPVLRRKVTEVIRRSGLLPASHEGKELARVLEFYPRDELFQTDIEELAETALGIARIKERQQTRLFIRRDHYNRFMSCLVFMPRESYNTEIRQKIQHILCRHFDALNAEFTTFFGESVLVRTHFVLRTDPTKVIEFDSAKLEQKILQVTRSWQDELGQELINTFGEERGIRSTRLYQNAFPLAYRDRSSPRFAVQDIKLIEALSDTQPLTTWFYQKIEEPGDHAHFSVYHKGASMPLSDVIPILENMGLKILGEYSYEITDRDGNKTWVHDFQMIYRCGDSIDANHLNEIFSEAFIRIWRGETSNDSYNRLLLAARLDWRKVTLLRACGRYSKQIGIGLSQEYIADTLLRHLDITALLLRLFETRLNPALDLSIKQRQAEVGVIETDFIALLDSVATLSEDKVLRYIFNLIKAMLRTNFFQLDEQQRTKDYMSFKIDPHQIPDIPLPRPMFEIFVYSNRMEGVHLRGGKVARGGLRWSDRIEDYRTEVLGLVKAQQVKNAVIVPVGAKGGFVAKKAQDMEDRDAHLKEGIACYKTFINGLLDVTDNLAQGDVVPPPEVIRYDEDDPYLVVAADKGTATFSDISNGIAEARDFWLRDAFASGGSNGYDHKGMGITARGAWVSVERHFRELGLNTRTTEFTVIGVGDMGGDVFGNGMLLSEHIRLVAAFNHLHIFIDPNPDAVATFAERKRLFETPGTQWSDFEAELISAGGGIFDRGAKSIDISPEMQERFGIKAAKLAPNDLLHALLKAPVDLIWNGGIGTYVKAASESHADAGDKANDPIRVNGNELRARVLGEGGNLGATQLGRIEFGLNAGYSNTDFIDNAGGVDCSDHEVNIKILLNEIVSAGDLTTKQRNQLLAKMTDEVAELVLQNNYRQVQAISIALSQAEDYMNEYHRFMKTLEEDGKLNRALEFLPDDDSVKERIAQDQTLTRPELSILISYAKADLKERLSDTGLIDDPQLARAIETAFPASLVKRYPEALYQHRLRREIVATQLANDVVNFMGITFVTRMQAATDSTAEQVLRAYVATKDILQIEIIWEGIEALDNRVDAGLQIDMMRSLMRLVRHFTRWLLRGQYDQQNTADVVARFQAGIIEINQHLADYLYGNALKQWRSTKNKLAKADVPDALATLLPNVPPLQFALDIIEASEETQAPLLQVAEVFFKLGQQLEIDWFHQQITELPVSNLWHAQVRDSFRDDVDKQLRRLTQAVINDHQGHIENPTAAVKQWFKQHQAALVRWQNIKQDMRDLDSKDFALFIVALRELAEL